MYLNHLVFHNFRNYFQLDLAFEDKITLFYGPNASGKTSLLEAIFFLATTRSPRTRNERLLIRQEAQSETGETGGLPFTRLVAEVQQAREKVQLEAIIQARADEKTNSSANSVQKTLLIEGKATRALDFVGQLRVVLFSPTDIMLIDGPPNERRRYLDLTLSQTNSRYLRNLARYQELLKQRNSLLRAWREQRRPQKAVDDELAFWDKELATTASNVLNERLRAITDLNRLVAPLFCTIMETNQELKITYQPSFAFDASVTNASLAQEMLHQLQKLRGEELKRGLTLIGPHRDDLFFTLEGQNLGFYGSRGQQRSATLALKLGEAALMQQRTGEKPVLLLDDLLSELDRLRREHILQLLQQQKQQILLTTTDLSVFTGAFLQDIQRKRVEMGEIYPG